MPHPGKILIAVGVLLVAAGAFLLLGGRLDWLGRLPGDINVKKEGFSFHFPVTTCLIASLLLSILYWIFRK